MNIKYFIRTDLQMFKTPLNNEARQHIRLSNRRAFKTFAGDKDRLVVVEVLLTSRRGQQ